MTTWTSSEKRFLYFTVGAWVFALILAVIDYHVALIPLLRQAILGATPQ